MAEDAEQKMMAASEKVSALNTEMEQSNDRTDEIRRDYQNIMKWSEIFDSSDMAVKKMIAGYLIKKSLLWQDRLIQRETAEICTIKCDAGRFTDNLGERLNGIQEVSGSIPLISTKKGRKALALRPFFYL